jgi:hypothetical protein
LFFDRLAPVTAWFSSSPITLVFSLSVIFRDNLRPEYAMAPWCLLTAALTLSALSTHAWVEWIEIGFWFLYFYWRLSSSLECPSGLRGHPGHKISEK